VCGAVGGREGSVLLEQRVHYEPDRRKLDRHPDDHVSGSLSDLQGALEPDDSGARLQRTKDVHGDQQQAVRRTHIQLQG